VIHSCLIVSNGLGDKVPANEDEKNYFIKFAPFINAANQKQIYQLLNEAVYHIERNAHPGILFADLSFQFIELLKAGRTFS